MPYVVVHPVNGILVGRFGDFPIWSTNIFPSKDIDCVIMFNTIDNIDDYIGTFPFDAFDPLYMPAKVDAPKGSATVTVTELERAGLSNLLGALVFSNRAGRA